MSNELSAEELARREVAKHEHPRSQLNITTYGGMWPEQIMIDGVLYLPESKLREARAALRTAQERIEALERELKDLHFRHADLGRYAVHLGNCKFMEKPDICTCGLAAHSEVLDDSWCCRDCGRPLVRKDHVVRPPDAEPMLCYECWKKQQEALEATLPPQGRGGEGEEG